MRPAYLELREEAGGTWQVLWKVPTRGEWRLSLEPRFPDGCAAVGERTSWDVDAALTSRWALRCSGGLAGGRLEILGLPATMTDVLVRLARADGVVETLRLTPGEPAVVLGAEAHPGSAPRPICGSASSTSSWASTISCSSWGCSFSCAAGAA